MIGRFKSKIMCIKKKYFKLFSGKKEAFLADYGPFIVHKFYQITLNNTFSRVSGIRKYDSGISFFI